MELWGQQICGEPYYVFDCEPQLLIFQHLNGQHFANPISIWDFESTVPLV